MYSRHIKLCKIYEENVNKQSTNVVPNEKNVAVFHMISVLKFTRYDLHIFCASHYMFFHMSLCKRILDQTKSSFTAQHRRIKELQGHRTIVIIAFLAVHTLLGRLYLKSRRMHSWVPYATHTVPVGCFVSRTVAGRCQVNIARITESFTCVRTLGTCLSSWHNSNCRKRKHR